MADGMSRFNLILEMLAALTKTNEIRRGVAARLAPET
jgi:hypothetical protein